MAKPIGFDRELVATSFALVGRGSAPLSARDGLPPALVRALEDAAPAYRRLWWPRHAAANAAFAARLASLLTTHGDSVARQLTRIYRVPWPQTPPVVEVVAYANWAGAYTLVHPTVITVSSLFRGHDGTLGLEMLFHEQSHAMTDSVSAAIAAAGLAPTSRAASEIEHWIIFYTAGEVVRRTVAGHTPFADWRGLWKIPGFDRGYALLTAAWQPYLDGRQAFATAVAQLAAGHQ